MFLTKINVIGACLCLALLGAACQGNGGQKTDGVQNAQAEGQRTAEALQFPFPKIPSMMTDPGDRKAYLLKHYWEGFNFGDTALVNCREVTEQGFVNYIALLAEGDTPQELADESMGNFCVQLLAESQAAEVMMPMVDDYLYHPNSPYYNEPLYALYLRRMMDSPALDEGRKSTLRFKLELISRNQPGMRATAFDYLLADGKRRTLYQTPVKGNRLLLVFYDPECPSCHETLTAMMNDAFLADAVATGKLSVLAVYTEGDEEAWRKALPEMPEGWTVATDRQAVKDGALYDLRAMPCMYLLDGDKTVLCKDASYAEIKEYLY